jgi:hypothetical protein
MGSTPHSKKQHVYAICTCPPLTFFSSVSVAKNEEYVLRYNELDA